jgi:hypothetical protein
MYEYELPTRPMTPWHDVGARLVDERDVVETERPAPSTLETEVDRDA